MTGKGRSLGLSTAKGAPCRNFILVTAVWGLLRLRRCLSRFCGVRREGGRITGRCRSAGLVLVRGTSSSPFLRKLTSPKGMSYGGIRAFR